MNIKHWLAVFLLVLLGAGTGLFLVGCNQGVTGKGMNIPEPEAMGCWAEFKKSLTGGVSEKCLTG